MKLLDWKPCALIEEKVEIAVTDSIRPAATRELNHAGIKLKVILQAATVMKALEHVEWDETVAGMTHS